MSSQPWFEAPIRLWYVGRLLALAKWMQRTALALNMSANRHLDAIRGNQP